jgi:hypothetical protein
MMPFPVRRATDRALLLALPALLAACASGTAAGSKASADVPAPGALPLKYTPKPTSGAISAGDLMSRLYAFADDSLMGRDAGTEGSYKATAMLAREVERLGLKPAGENGTYFQVLPLKNKRIDSTSTFLVGTESLKLRTEWGFSGARNISWSSAPIVFGGELGKKALPADQAAGKVVVYTMPLSQAGVELALEGKDLLPAGAKGMVVIIPPQAVGIFGFIMGTGAFVDDAASPDESRVFALAAASPKLFGKPVNELTVGVSGNPLTIDAKVAVTPSPFQARNVVAILPGSDPALRNSYVAIGAHSDHVGMARRAADHDSMLVLNRIARPGGAEDQGKMPTAEQ